ncbi:MULTISPECIES: hypothetical protein [unclassified Peribacillus]|uniref:hypothetical protein n=1 Tax=unclassified Peribacillus TaxID=2675266 RepID=UPI00366D02D5
MDMLFPHIWNKTITRLKKFTTLLPKLLAETPEALSARERISKINWNFLKEKTAGKLDSHQACLQLERLYDAAVNFCLF